MRSLLGPLLNRAPVPLSTKTSSGFGRWFGDKSQDREAQLDAMSASATLFGIVDLTSGSTAKSGWHLHRKLKRNPARSNKICGYDGCDAVGVTLVEDHAALTLLNAPNPFYTRQEYMQTGQQHLDLTGESWTVIGRDPVFGTIPTELWNVRPDRITVVEHPAEFLLGYIYTDDQGKEYGIRKEDMLYLRMPDPKDPYRGLGPVASIVDQVYGTKAASAYQAAFFRNGARPGGIVKLSRTMSDDEFDQLVDRFNYNHRGINNAGRTAFLEEGDWVDVKPYTFEDMQFVESAHLSRDTIMMAFRMSKFAMGVDNELSNRATADASATWFAETQTVPRLDRWQQMLNNDFLPQFPGYQYDLEFVYSNPVPRDREADVKERQANVAMFVQLKTAGVDPQEAALYCGLPEFSVKEVASDNRPGEADSSGANGSE